MDAETKAMIDALQTKLEAQAKELDVLRKETLRAREKAIAFENRVVDLEATAETAAGTVDEVRLLAEDANDTLSSIQSTHGLTVERRGKGIRFRPLLPDTNTGATTIKTIEVCDAAKYSHGAIQLRKIDTLTAAVGTGDDQKVPHVAATATVIDLGWDWIVQESVTAALSPHLTDTGLVPVATAWGSPDLFILTGNSLGFNAPCADLTVNNGRLKIAVSATSLTDSVDLTGIVPESADSADTALNWGGAFTGMTGLVIPVKCILRDHATGAEFVAWVPIWATGEPV